MCIICCGVIAFANASRQVANDVSISPGRRSTNHCCAVLFAKKTCFLLLWALLSSQFALFRCRNFFVQNYSRYERWHRPLRVGICTRRVPSHVRLCQSLQAYTNGTVPLNCGVTADHSRPSHVPLSLLPQPKYPPLKNSSTTVSIKNG